MTAASKESSKKFPGMEFVLGGLAAMGSGCFTNPIEVIKIRLQLQGELAASGTYTKLYKNPIHAVYVVAKHEGIFALQAGFIPAIGFQLVLNGVRLGVFNVAKKQKLTLNAKGKTSIVKTALINGTAGSVANIIASPLYMVKTQLQSQATSSIAVGHQHTHRGTWDAFRKLWQVGKFRSLYRGWNAGVPRLSIGSATQFTLFSLALDWFKAMNTCPDHPVLVTFLASFVAGSGTTLVIQPLDVAATRLYNQGMEFVLGGLAAMGAGCFTNPIEVIKIRLQLQGELTASGTYTKLYKNPIHAVYVVAKHEGIFALQAGFIPAIGFQLVLNGVRLGVFNVAKKHELTLNAKGKTSIIKTALITGTAGSVGAILGSPLYMVKTQLQSQAASSIAVGHQHTHRGTWDAFHKLWQEGKFRSLYRGWNAGVPRLFVGSATQLTLFSLALDWFKAMNICPDHPVLLTFLASFVAGSGVALFIQPFDVAATRLYNQGVDVKGKGLLYNGVSDALIKIAKTEGIYGLYKGTFPTWLRIAPHTVLCLVFYDELDKLYSRFTD